MTDRISYALSLLLLLLVLGSSYWYSRSLDASPAGGSGRIGQVDFFGEQIAVTGFDANGSGHFRLFADRMSHHANSDDVVLENPHLFSIAPQQPRMEASAKDAIAHDNAKDILMRGDVVLTRSAEDQKHPSMRVTTQRLTLFPDEDRVHTDVDIRIEDGGSRIEGVGFDYDNVTRRAEVLSTAHGRIAARRTQ
jgi:lipopolysaccharide export system protein LptC